MLTSTFIRCHASILHKVVTIIIIGKMELLHHKKTITANLEDNGALWIYFNRSESYNSVSFEMYDELNEVFNYGENCPSCKLIVLTGKGQYFTSGNDQKNFLHPDAFSKKDCFRNFIDKLIDLQKPLVALVNGPAVGMGVTLLNHCDLVLASDQATFTCPFTRLALVPEGCSSYLFPRMMGQSKANELLMFNKKIAAEEARDLGLVSRVIPHGSFQSECRSFINEQCQLNGQVLIRVKSLIKPPEYREKLKRVNKIESDSLNEALMLPEAIEVAMKFLSKRNSKL